MALPFFSGVELQKIHDELVEWYLTTKEELVRQIEDSQPYGSVTLDPKEQLHRAITMTSEEWQQELGRIQLRFRGHPDAEQKVQQAVQDYMIHIQQLSQRYPQQAEEEFRG